MGFAVKARIVIDVIDDNGASVREQRVVQINKRVRHIYEAVERGSVARLVAQDMLSHALRAVEPSVRAQQAMPGAGPLAAPVGRRSAVASSLGLDLIQEAAAKEGPSRPIGPGPIGFGRHGERR